MRRNRRIIIGEKERGAVGRCLHGIVHSDGPAGSRAILHENLLREHA